MVLKKSNQSSTCEIHLGSGKPTHHQTETEGEERGQYNTVSHKTSHGFSGEVRLNEDLDAMIVS